MRHIIGVTTSGRIVSVPDTENGLEMLTRDWESAAPADLHDAVCILTYLAGREGQGWKLIAGRGRLCTEALEALEGLPFGPSSDAFERIRRGRSLVSPELRD